MTAQEKAKELFDKMLYCYQGHIDKYTAKQCALIAVEERLNEAYLWAGEPDNININWEDNRWKYLKELKREVEKL